MRREFLMRRIIRNTIFMSLFGIIARGAGLIRYVFLVTFLSNEAFERNVTRNT